MAEVKRERITLRRGYSPGMSVLLLNLGVVSAVVWIVLVVVLFFASTARDTLSVLANGAGVLAIALLVPAALLHYWWTVAIDPARRSVTLSGLLGSRREVPIKDVRF